MKFVDWFSGIGGFRVAFESAGHECVWSCEIDRAVRKVYAARFGHEPQASDITQVKASDIPDADLWIAGFPCQDLSTAGRREGINKGERSGLIWKLLDLARIKKPKYILLENVPGLLSGKDSEDEEGEDETGSVSKKRRVDDGATVPIPSKWMGTLLEELADIWTIVGWRVLDAQFLGVPQRRRRVFLVGGPGAERISEILFDPESGGRDIAAGEKAGKIAAGELARSLGGVGGGQDYGANKGTIVKQAVSCKWAKGSSGPAGDEHHNLVAGTLKSCGQGQGRKTPEVDQIVGVNMQGNKGGAGAFTDKRPSINAMHGHDIHAVAAPLTAGSHPNSNAPGRRQEDDENIVIAQNGSDVQVNKGRSPCIRAGMGEAGTDGPIIANSLTAEGHDASEDGSGRGVPLIVQEDNQNGVKLDTQAGSLRANAPGHQPGGSLIFEPRIDRNGRGAPSEVAPPLKAENGQTGKGNGAPHVMAFKESQSGVREGEVHSTLDAHKGSRWQEGVVSSMMVRRLSPTECERLQGEPDGFTCLCNVRPDCPDRRIPPWVDPSKFKLGGCGHSACGCKCPDSPRYKSLGNSVAVPVIRWLANRF